GKVFQMFKIAIFLFVFALSLLLQLGTLAAPIQVVTTTSDLQSLVEVVGGDRVSVRSIALPAQDPHSFEPKLGDVRQLRQAQLVVKIGLDHDLWLDRLLQDVDNPAIQKGGPGYVDTSQGIPLLEVQSRAIAPTDGHNHGAGNPHYWLDPLNAETMTGAILEGLERIDPENASTYETNRELFLGELKSRIADWQKQLAPYQGTPILTYHNSWPYLARRFRLNIVDAIEPKPGIPPSPNRLTALIREIKDQPIPIVIREPYEAEQIPTLLSRKTGAKVVTLISSVNAIPQATDYFSLFDYNVHNLLNALQTQ
ncbi:MAG: metal ABC transporter substrate-binding protein, partial [Leptolyngbyaceae cyanobacterium bins.59]|nr:metal ABC transporter substrate-binding protein [Leptolyngbyaceae cyanobacterium bins.59]